MLIVMLKTRLFPHRKVLSDRSDIVASHANFCGARMNALMSEMRSRIRRAQNGVTVPT